MKRSKNRKTGLNSPLVTDCWLPWKHESGMKFQQRLLILAGLGLVALVGLVVLGSTQLMAILDIGQSNRPIYRESPYHGRVLRSVSREVCQGMGTVTPTTTITTQALKNRTTYDMKSNGQYVIPTEKSDSTEPLTVIVVPHSHNDPGWQRTVEEYYVTKTKNILNNMVHKLRIYPNMTFVWAETVFLSMWWNELEDDTKAQVRRLVRRGQLEIVLGGWVMPDEASTHYYSIIDQLMEGHQWLGENLRTKPVNSWSIDPFGHSGTMPYLWKSAGLENMVIQRIHQSTKAALARNKSLEFNWRQVWDTTGHTDILCHTMPYMLYGTKHTCGPNPDVCLMFDFWQADHGFHREFSKPVTVKNVEVLATALYRQYRSKASLYRYNTILVPLGDDFRYDQESEWDKQYQNYDMLMQYMNTKEEWEVNIKFGTLSDYFKAVRNSEEILKQENPIEQFPSLSGDFFPYSDKNNAYWTGYFTTRPFDKKLSRDVQANLRAAEMLYVLTIAYMKKWNRPFKYYHETATHLQQARRNLGVFLHHDAITGTSKAYVVEDFERLLMAAYNSTQKVLTIATQTLLTQGRLDSPLIISPTLSYSDHRSLPRRQVLPVVEFGSKVMLYNPTMHDRTEMWTLLVNSDHLIIRDSDNQVVPHQINPVWDTKSAVHERVYEIVFLKKLSPLSIETIFLYKEEKVTNDNSFPAEITIYNTKELAVPPHSRFYQNRPRDSNHFSGPIVLENDFLRAEFSPKDGMLKQIENKATGNVTFIQLEFLQYTSQGSGAYLFYPTAQGAGPTLKGLPIVRVTRGPLMSQVEVIYRHIQHLVQVYHHPGAQGQGLHIENLINMYAQELHDREIIMRFNTNIKNSNLSYYTDENGFQLIGRSTDTKLRTEANYYPMTSMAVLEDHECRLTLHSGQPHGVAGLQQGQLEVMLERQLMYDDERGLGEGVEDNKLTLSRFILQIEPFTEPQSAGPGVTTFPSLLALSIGEALQQPIVTMYTQVNTEILSPVFTPSQGPFPCDITLVSLRNLVNEVLDYQGTSLVLHRSGFLCSLPSDGTECSLTSNVTISTLLKDLSVVSVRETTLTHMYEKRTWSPHSELDIPPMEITSYKLTL
ncbi:alpha-mannosidase 2-like isoform X2 [Mizuhopecten yessoensis]|uniref:Alpha-mannosidase n=1 Tax=Mizuhopecten yessoensis TaxID=6573 RepID=A0A210QQ00_MIZYE|nr:alpha-mannosidase 2-like isoform X2 [Mizuhopecten yessoensis]OWF50816.1 Alpha-mannosidase 2 [Mizuhopecten yessoensis]